MATSCSGRRIGSRITAKWPEVATSRWQHARETITVRHGLKVRLNSGGLDIAWVDDEWRLIRYYLPSAAVGPNGSDERRISDKDIVFDGEVGGGGYRYSIAECARELIVDNCPRGADIVPIVVTKPSAGTDGYANSIANQRLKTIEQTAPSLNDCILRVGTFCLARLGCFCRETTFDCVVCDNSTCVVTTIRIVIHHVDTTKESLLLY